MTLEESTDVLDNCMAWEAGEMTPEREAAFFQQLIFTGLAWKLQGCYGRRAMELIREGRCTDDPT